MIAAVFLIVCGQIKGIKPDTGTKFKAFRHRIGIVDVNTGNQHFCIREQTRYGFPVPATFLTIAENFTAQCREQFASGKIKAYRVAALQTNGLQVTPVIAPVTPGAPDHLPVAVAPTGESILR